MKDILEAIRQELNADIGTLIELLKTEQAAILARYQDALASTAAGNRVDVVAISQGVTNDMASALARYKAGVSMACGIYCHKRDGVQQKYRLGRTEGPTVRTVADAICDNDRVSDGESLADARDTLRDLEGSGDHPPWLTREQVVQQARETVAYWEGKNGVTE
jgi:hypothetical protein